MKRMVIACAAGIALAACGDKEATKVQGSKPPEAHAKTGAAIPAQAEALPIDMGVPKKEVALCAAETNTVNRLACYDLLAARHDQAPKETLTSAATKGKWITQTNTDPLTDKSVFLALLEAESGKGAYGDTVRLLVRCQNNTTEAYINWNSFLGSDGIRVTSRIDKNPAKTSTWSISTDNKASFMPSAAATLKGFIGATSFVANLTPYSESPITAVFDITGAERAFEDISKGCGWKQ